MTREIEILWEVNEPLASALEKLSHLRAHGVKETTDTYYTHEKQPRLQPDKDGRLIECLRVREKDGHSFMTHKKDHFLDDGTWSHSDEDEMPIEDAHKNRELLGDLGFKELVRIDNHKHTFTNDEYEIVLEDVKDLGVFLEIEAKHPSDDVAAEKKRIRAFAATLGIALGEELNVGKPELMLRRRR